MADDPIYLNGVSALTGEYLVPPLAPADAARLARGAPPPAETAGWFRRLVKRLTETQLFGLPMDVDPTDLAQAGWAVVFPAGAAAARDRLRALLDHRKGRVGGLYKELEYRPGEGRERWLERHGAHLSNVEPGRVPYYLLLVGHPDEIPFEFQYELDVDYAVGRLAFDRPDDYAAYAAAVVAYETGATISVAREVAYWGTRHDGDRATELSADHLLGPLVAGEPAAGGVPARRPPAERFGYAARALVGPGATKANLLDVLRGRERPSVLFTASHGMGGWPAGDPRQRPGQGALLCQDWTGFGKIRPDHYLTAADLGADLDCRGLVAFVFACYGAGTPRYDPFLRTPGGGPREVADGPFVSALAQRLLAAGALAVIGHVERAWGYSIRPPAVGAQLLPFRNLVGRVLAGEPAGHATLDFSQRYATASVALANLLAPHLPGARAPADADLAWAWVERNDAQNYVLLGDPAVALRDAGGPAAGPPPPAAAAARPGGPPAAPAGPTAPAPAPPAGPGATGVAFTPPAGFHDASEYAFAAPGGRRVTVTPAGPGLATDALLLAAARAYAQQLADLCGVPDAAVGPVRARPDGAAFVTVTARFPAPPGPGTAEHLALLRLPAGTAVRLAVTAPAGDPDAEADLRRLVESAAPAPGDAPVAFAPVAFAPAADGPAARRVGPVAVELPAGCRETTAAVTFRDLPGGREVRVRLEPAPPAPVAFGAGPEAPAGRVVAGPDGPDGPFAYEAVPSPWGAPPASGAVPAFAAADPPPPAAGVVRVVGGRRLVVEAHSAAGDDVGELARRVADTARPVGP